MHIQRSTSNKRRILKAAAGSLLLLVAGCVAVWYSHDQTVPEEATVLADFTAQAPSGHAIFYTEPGFAGTSFEMDVTIFNWVMLSDIGLNAKISSFKVGPNTRLKLCRHADCRHEGMVEAWSDFVEIVGPYNQGVMWNTNNHYTSAIRLYPYDPATEKYVQLFSRSDFDAAFAGIFGIGWYNGDDMRIHHMNSGGQSTAASSIIVPEGVYAKIFKADHFTGDAWVITGPASFDFANKEGAEDWDKGIRSMMVGKIQDLSVGCYWQRSASANTKLTKAVEVGWSKT